MWGQVCGEVIMQWQTKTAVRAKDGVYELIKPLKQVFCWVIGHNWRRPAITSYWVLGVTGNVSGAGSYVPPEEVIRQDEAQRIVERSEHLKRLKRPCE
jgi:hypothetical protein